MRRPATTRSASYQWNASGSSLSGPSYGICSLTSVKNSVTPTSASSRSSASP